MHLIHTVFPGPILGSPDKKSGNLDVIDGIEPAEAGSFLAIQLVITRIDHGADTPDHFVAVKHHPQLVTAIIQRRVLRKTVHLIRMKSRHILLAILI